MELQRHIGIRVRELRKAKGLTQEAAAELTGRSVDTLSLIERGRMLPSLDTLDAIGKGFGIRLSNLVDFDDAQPTSPDIVAMREAARCAIDAMSGPVLAVAVQQLKALGSLMDEKPA